MVYVPKSLNNLCYLYHSSIKREGEEKGCREGGGEGRGMEERGMQGGRHRQTDRQTETDRQSDSNVQTDSNRLDRQTVTDWTDRQ